MKSHRKINALYAHYQARNLQARQNLYMTIRNRDGLIIKREELKVQQDVIKKLIKEYCYKACNNRATLFEEMRKVAVFRRKLLSVELECLQVQSEIDELTLKKKEISHLLLILENKSKKFIQLLAQSKLVQLRKNLSEEESELEEYLS
ncbi:hypothetical protein SC206_19880 [Rouxiella sp. T17]|uniref:hypothetical protein n=1 Tax=Rouxiella sp. T17 TaxID=3085684 RepID=UPI002FC5A936